MALNTAIIFLKSEKRRSFIQIDDVSLYKLKEDDYNLEDEQNLKLMYECIQKLNPIDKALIFYYLEDFSGKEIAEQMGISEGNARVKLNRAKDKLKELINKRASRD
nr:sigma-70 family RNA polymerase sigma factor [Epilithonimonas hominis]